MSGKENHKKELTRQVWQGIVLSYMATLTERQRRFVENFLTTGNASVSARKAGYKNPDQQGARLLRNDRVVTELTRHQESKTTIAGITREAKKERLMHIIEGEDDKLSMQAIDIDNKMQAEYVQKIEDVTNYNDLSADEVLVTVLLELESRGYKVVKPK